MSVETDGPTPAKTPEQRWNDRYPPGTPVRYWPVRGRDENIETRTRSQAWTLGSGHVVVAVENKAGGVSIDHLDVLTEDA